MNSIGSITSCMQKYQNAVQSSGVMDILKNALSTSQLANVMCLDFSENNFTIGYNRLGFGVEKAVEGTGNFPLCQIFKPSTPNCDATNYNTFFSKTTHSMVIFYKNIKTNLQSRENPTIYYESVSKSINLDLTKDIELVFKLKKNIIVTSQNYYSTFIPKSDWLLPDIYETYTTIDIIVNQIPRLASKVDPTSGEPLFGFTVKFERDDQILKINRAYLTLDYILANIFAVIDLIIMIFSILFHLYNYKRFEYHIMNKLYYFDEQLFNDGDDKKIEIFDVKSDVGN